MHVNIIRPGALGDTLVAQPVAALIKSRHPHALLTLVASRAAAGLDGMLPCVDRVEFIDSPALLPLWGGSRDGRRDETLERLLGADLTLAFLGTDGAFAARWRGLGGGPITVLSGRPAPGSRTHVSDFLACAAARACGWPEPCGAAPRVVVPAGAAELAAGWLGAQPALRGRPHLVVHPGSGGESKCWPPARFADLAGRLPAETGAGVVLLCGPADEDAVRLVSAACPEAPVIRDAPLPVVAAVLASALCCLSNDSGIAHLAAAAGAPTVALFGPTDPGVWGPRGRRVVVVQGRSPCAPCTDEARRACRARRCLDALSARDVMDAVVGLALEAGGDRCASLAPSRYPPAD